MCLSCSHTVAAHWSHWWPHGNILIGDLMVPMCHEIWQTDPPQGLPAVRLCILSASILLEWQALWPWCTFVFAVAMMGELVGMRTLCNHAGTAQSRRRRSKSSRRSFTVKICMRGVHTNAHIYTPTCALTCAGIIPQSMCSCAEHRCQRRH